MAETPLTTRRTSGRSTLPADSPSEERLLRLLDLLPDSVLCLSPEWRITYANEQARVISHIKPEDLLKTYWELYPETMDSALFEACHQAMESQQPMRLEYLYEPSNLWLETQIIPLGDDGIALHYNDITARHQAETAINTLNRQFLQIFDTAPNSVICFDRNWICTYYNRTATLVLKFEDILGTNLWTKLPQVSREPFKSNLLRTMEERIPSSFEAYIGDGLDLWLRIWARPYEDGVVIYANDISDRKRAESARDTTLRQLAQLLESTFDGVISLTQDWTFTFLNQRAVSILGREDLLGRNLWEEFPEAITSSFYAFYNRTMLERVPTEFEEFYPGHLNRWLSVQCRPSEEGIVVFFRDVTNRRSTEIVLREQQQQLLIQQKETERQRAELEAIYTTAPIGLALFDPVHFRYLRLNNRQAAFFGLPASEILGKTLTEMAPIAGLQEMFQQVAEGKPVMDHLLEGRLATDPPDEHRFWTVNYFPVYGADGSLTAISAASHEITHQKKSELALMQSEKLAAVGRLASSISHEINNPLEAITNLLFLINLDEHLPDPVRSYVHMAQSELGRVSQIVTQTLRFHRQAVKPTFVTAGELVNAVLKLYQGRLANSGIRVDAKYVSNTPVLCFENDIRQVLNNLIANAIDAMRGGGHLMVRAHDATLQNGNHDKAHKGIRITIADTGHGMSSGVSNRIFEPFFTTKDLNGTGLGLWISAGIVAQHQGQLTLRSNESPEYHGTIFSLFLPVAPESL